MTKQTLFWIGLGTAILGSLIAFGIVYVFARKKIQDEYDNSIIGAASEIFRR